MQCKSTPIAETEYRECFVYIPLLNYDVYQTTDLVSISSRVKAALLSATKCQLMREHSALSIESTSPKCASTDTLARCATVCLTDLHFTLPASIQLPLVKDFLLEDDLRDRTTDRGEVTLPHASRAMSNSNIGTALLRMLST